MYVKKQIEVFNEEVNFKKVHNPESEQIDLAVLQWFWRMRSSNIAVNGPVIKI